MANPSDLLLFYRRRNAGGGAAGDSALGEGKSSRSGGLSDPIRPDNLADIRVEVCVVICVVVVVVVGWLWCWCLNCCCCDVVVVVAAFLGTICRSRALRPKLSNRTGSTSWRCRAIRNELQKNRGPFFLSNELRKVQAGFSFHMGKLILPSALTHSLPWSMVS